MVRSRGGASVQMDDVPGRSNIRRAATYGLVQAEVPVQPAAEAGQDNGARWREQAGPSLLVEDEHERPRMARDHVLPLRILLSDARGFTDAQNAQKAQKLEEWIQLWTNEWTSDGTNGDGCNDCASTLWICNFDYNEPRLRLCEYAATCILGLKDF